MNDMKVYWKNDLKPGDTSGPQTVDVGWDTATAKNDSQDDSTVLFEATGYDNVKVTIPAGKFLSITYKLDQGNTITITNESGSGDIISGEITGIGDPPPGFQPRRK